VISVLGNAIDLAAILKYQESRDASDVEAVRRRRIFIDVQFRDSNAPGHLRGNLLQHGRDHAAGSAPRRPHVEQHRDRGAFDFSRERRVGYRHRLAAGGGERRLTAPADGREALRDLLWRHTIDGVARGTPNH
jgi:hypothetical protein